MSVTLQVDVARSAEGCHSKSDPHDEDDDGDGTAAVDCSAELLSQEYVLTWMINCDCEDRCLLSVSAIIFYLHQLINSDFM